MLTNKRIHELLKWVKSQKKTKRVILNEKEVKENQEKRHYYSSRGLAVLVSEVEPIYGEEYEFMDPIYEIIQHLLEVDIENSKGRKYCETHNKDFKDCWVKCHAVRYSNKYACPTCYVEKSLHELEEDDKIPHPDSIYLCKKPQLVYEIPQWHGEVIFPEKSQEDKEHS